MNGIEILKTIEITTIQSWIGYGFIISIIALLLFTIVAAILEHVDSIFQIVPYILAAISGIGVLFFLIMMPLGPKKFTGEYKYIVQVEDSVSLNEFHKKYEILSEDYANIYTVKERIVK